MSWVKCSRTRSRPASDMRVRSFGFSASRSSAAASACVLPSGKISPASPMTFGISPEDDPKLRQHGNRSRKSVMGQNFPRRVIPRDRGGRMAKIEPLEDAFEAARLIGQIPPRKKQRAGSRRKEFDREQHFHI